MGHLLRLLRSCASVSVLILAQLMILACGGAPAPVATAVASPAVPAQPPRAFVDHLPPDVDGMFRWDFARIRQWPHAHRFLDTYRRGLGQLACQVDVYDRAHEALSAVWVTGDRGFVLMIRGDLRDGDEACFPGGTSARERVGRFEVNADEWGAVARVDEDILIYGNPERVRHVLSWVEAGTRQAHREALQEQMGLAEFGQHPLSVAFALRSPGHVAEGAATLHGFVSTCDASGRGCAEGEPGALDARATVDFVTASAASRVLRDVDRLRGMAVVRLMLGDLLNAFDIRQTDTTLEATLQLDERDAAMVARQMPAMIRVGDRLARGRRP